MVDETALVAAPATAPMYEKLGDPPETAIVWPFTVNETRDRAYVGGFPAFLNIFTSAGAPAGTTRPCPVTWFFTVALYWNGGLVESAATGICTVIPAPARADAAVPLSWPDAAVPVCERASGAMPAANKRRPAQNVIDFIVIVPSGDRSFECIQSWIPSAQRPFSDFYGQHPKFS